MIVRCDSCAVESRFDQPYAFHAGFGNRGFLYDDAGLTTLVWSSFDPAFVEVVGDKHPWALTAAEQEALESALAPAPNGGRWRFGNPARCRGCRSVIRGPMTEDIYFLVFPGSPDLSDLGIRSAMRDTG